MARDPFVRLNIKVRERGGSVTPKTPSTLEIIQAGVIKELADAPEKGSRFLTGKSERSFYDGVKAKLEAAELTQKLEHVEQNHILELKERHAQLVLAVQKGEAEIQRVLAETAADKAAAIKSVAEAVKLLRESGVQLSDVQVQRLLEAALATMTSQTDKPILESQEVGGVIFLSPKPPQLPPSEK